MKSILHFLAISVFTSILTVNAVGQTNQFLGLEPGEVPGKRTINLRVEGIAREVIIYRTSKLPANKPVPVVFVFHGTGGSGEVAYDKMGWKEKADEEGFMAVFPSALRYHIFDETLVKTGRCCTTCRVTRPNGTSLAFISCSIRHFRTSICMTT